MRKITFFYPIVLLALFSLAACATVEPWSESPTDKAVVKDGKDLAKQQEKKLVLHARKEIRRQLDTGEFLSALEMIKQEVKRGTAANELTVEHLKALNGAIGLGETRLAENHTDQAGLLFRTALDNSPKDHGQASNVRLSRKELESKIEICAEKLMSKGLTAYRAGDLGSAIEVWKKIIAFHPQHQACNNAIKTAEMQRATLKKLGSDN